MTEPNLYNVGYDVGFEDGFKEAQARIKELEAKLGKGVLVEYDNGDVICLSGFAGGVSEGGAWSTLTLMKEKANGDISFREYKAVKNWETTLAELTGGKDE